MFVDIQSSWLKSPSPHRVKWMLSNIYTLTHRHRRTHKQSSMWRLPLIWSLRAWSAREIFGRIWCISLRSSQFLFFARVYISKSLCCWEPANQQSNPKHLHCKTIILVLEAESTTLPLFIMLLFCALFNTRFYSLRLMPVLFSFRFVFHSPVKCMRLCMHLRWA